MLVSIIVPAYNAAATLAECLQACLNQSHASTEVIVVDDRHVVLGRIRGTAFEGDPSFVEDVMRPGPATVRPDTPLETIVETLGSAHVASTLVTDPDGRFIGTVYLEDARSRLGRAR